MNARLRSTIAALGMAAAAVTVAVPSASASPTAQLTGGYTLVELYPEFVTALSSLGVTAGKTLPGTLYDRIGYFPITGGRVDAFNAKGEVLHSGGLRLAKGGTQVVLTDFIIDTASGSPRLTGLVTANGSLVGRIPLFNLVLPAIALPLQLPPAPDILLLSGTRATLAPEAATALNNAFATSAFVAGTNVAMAAVFGNF